MSGATGDRCLGDTSPVRVDDYLGADGGVALPPGSNLIAFLDRNVAAAGDDVAYRYIDYTHAVDGQVVELTWAQLNVRLRAIGARLQHVTAPGDRVAILAPQGLDYVVGFFAAIKAGAIAVPLFVPELPGHAERLDAVLGDTGPSTVLTTAAASANVHAFLRRLPHGRRPKVIAVDDVPDVVGDSFAPMQLSIDDTAYLQYTSGSTRTPTGVEITHRAAGTNLVQMIASLELDAGCHGVSWLPLYHDMGLSMIGFPVVYGGHVTLMSPVAFIRRPRRWIQVMAAEARRGRVVSPAPNFAFDLVVQRGRLSDNETADLSGVMLINGSEPVNIASIAAFTETFAPFGLSPAAIKPSYGMAETSLFVSTTAPGEPPKAIYLDRKHLGNGHAVRVGEGDSAGVAHVSCGRITRSQWAVIADPATGAELPDGRVGEIWLHGENIGRGYWRRPAETAETFHNTLHSRLPEGSHAADAPAQARWLRTGDYGVYIDDELYVTGRIKDMIIIDGQNHYPQDIEATAAEASPTVRAGYVAAFSTPANRDPETNHAGEALIIVAERASGTGRSDPQPVVDAIRAAVSRRHGLLAADIQLVKAGDVPRTTSGKIARHACRAHYLDGAFENRKTSEIPTAAT